MQEKKRDGLFSFITIMLTIAGIIVLVILLERTFGNQQKQVSIGKKTGLSTVAGQGSAAVKPGNTAEVKVTPSPTPDDGMPWLEGFNPFMSLNKISVWWGDDTADGKTSKDAYLRAAFLPMCKLLEEVEFTPPEEEIPMNFKLEYGKDKVQEIQVFSGDIAAFPELPGQYFVIPHIAAVGYALLPSDDVPETPRELMESAAMLGYFSTSNTHVVMDQELIRQVANDFFEIEKNGISKPEKLSSQRTALVFYNSAMKYYVNHYDGVIEYYGQNQTRKWYEVDDADVKRMLATLR